MNPFAAAVDLQRQNLEAAVDYTRKTTSLAEQVERVSDVDVGMTPSEVVYRENKLELLHYTPEEAGIDPETTHDIPILIVYALINKPYILDLQPDRSVVRRLLEAGFDVYLIDWGEPSLLDSGLTLDDYVSRYLDNCVETVCDRSGVDEVNLLGYCMGGTMSVMYASLFPEKVRNLGLMAAGLCFSDTGGVLELWGDEEYYDAEQVADAFGNIPADFLDAGFALMDPVANYVTKYLRLYDNVDDDEFVENFARMERWLAEGIDVAGETYQEFLEDIYQENKLARNEMELNGRHVDLESITMPIIQIVGQYDHLIPPESSTPFNELVASDDVETINARTGHIGLSVSSKSHAELWPSVADWFAERSKAADKPIGETAHTEGDDADLDSGKPDTAETAEAETALGDDAAEVEDEPGETETTAVEDEPVGEKAAEIADESAEDAGPSQSAFQKGLDGSDELALESLRGIGPQYSERLRSAGVENLEALAVADAEVLNEKTEIPLERLEDWIELAGNPQSE